VDANVEQLVSRLQNDPSDAEAYEALKTYYRDAHDASALTKLIASWAAYQTDDRAASRSYYEAAQVAGATVSQRELRSALLREAIARDPGHAQAVLDLADQLENQGDDHELAGFLDQHLRVLDQRQADPKLRATLYARLGTLWLSRFDRPDVAKRCYLRALDLNDRDPDILSGARALADKTSDSALLARILGAQAQAEPALERKHQLLRAQAEAYARDPNEISAAIQTLRAAHELAPDDIATMGELAEALARRATMSVTESSGRDRRRAAELYYLIAQIVPPSEGLAALQSALQLVPHHDAALLLLEQAAEQLGQQDILPQYWIAYIATAAEGPEVDQRRVSLARAYEHAGRLDDAIACLNEVQSPALAANLLTDLKASQQSQTASSDAHGAFDMTGSQPRHNERADLTDLVEVLESEQLIPVDLDVAASEIPPQTVETESMQLAREEQSHTQPKLERAERISLPPKRSLPELRRALRDAVTAADPEMTAACAVSIYELDPDDREAFVLLESYYRKRTDYVRLRELLSSAHMSGAAPEEGMRRLHEIAAISENQLGDLSGAIDAWNDVLALDPDHRDAHERLQRLLARTQRWDELAELLERELALLQDMARAAHEDDENARPTQHAEQVALLSQLASVHKERRRDAPAAVVALRRSYELQPEVKTRDTLCQLLLETGEYQELVPLLWECAHAAAGEREHLHILRQLSEILETAVMDHEAAFAVCERILQLRPRDADALACMQRIDEKSGNSERLLSTLERRATLLPRDARATAFIEMANIAERSLDDSLRAGDYYRSAYALDPARPGLLDTLCDMFARRQQHAELAGLLDQAHTAERDPARRVELQLRRARLFAGPLHKPEEAAATYRAVLEQQENTEALSYLLSTAREEHAAETTAALCARLAASVEDAAAARALLYERAQLLVTVLGRPRDGITTLGRLLTEVDPDYEPAIEWLSELAGNVGDNAGLALALTRRMQKSATPDARSALAQRVADLQENELGDREQAIVALQVWSEAAPTDPVPHRRLRPLLEAAGRYAELLTSCDALSELESEQGARDEASLAAAQVSFLQLRNAEAAWERLLPLLDRSDPKTMQLLLAIARQTQRCEELAGLCIRAAQATDEVERQGQLWSQAARIFREELGDPSKAFEAALRLLATDLKNRDALTRVEEAAAQAGLWPRLTPVFDRLLAEASSDAERIELLVRQANLLERSAGLPSDALDRVLQASALAPSDEALIARAERLAAQSDRSDELVQLCELQAAASLHAGAQVEWLLRAARFAAAKQRERQGQLDHSVTHAYMEAALAAAGSDVSLWEQCIAFAQHLDARSDDDDLVATSTHLRALIQTHRRVAERSAAPVGAALILRASRLLEDRLNDERGSFELLRAGSALFPLDENVYDKLLQRAEALGRLDALDAHLAREIDDALDPHTAANLLDRRARLLEGPLNRPEDAANVYVKLLQLRPDDTQTTAKLRDNLRRSQRFQDLLLVIHKQTQRAKQAADKTELLELLKETAHVWELDLKNRWEAVDAWRKVLEVAPHDGEAVRALSRLDRRSLTPSPAPAVKPPKTTDIASPSKASVPPENLDDNPDNAFDELPLIELITLDEEPSTTRSVPAPPIDFRRTGPRPRASVPPPPPGPSVRTSGPPRKG